MVSIYFSEKNALTFQYLGRLWVTPSNKSLKNAKTQKKTSNRKITPNVHWQYEHAGLCLHTWEWVCDMIVSTWQHMRVHRNDSAVQWVNITVVLTKQDTLKMWRNRTKNLCREQTDLGTVFSIDFTCLRTQTTWCQHSLLLMCLFCGMLESQKALTQPGKRVNVPTQEEDVWKLKNF